MRCTSCLAILVPLAAILIGIGYINQKEIFKFFVQKNFSKFTFGSFCIIQEETDEITIFPNKNGNKNTNDVSDCNASIIFSSIANEDEFYSILALHGGPTGFGETYMYGLWVVNSSKYSITQNLGDVLFHITNNVIHGKGTPNIIGKLIAFKHIYDEFKRSNLLTKSKEEDIKSISHHYDLDNDFYELFLGSKLSGYSCGIFNNEQNDVFKAQDNKWDLIINKIFINKSHKVIDIGSGWGYFPSYINNKTGAITRGITISKQQYDRSMIYKNANYELLDYRDLGNKYGEYFDRAVSIGMVEHVGLIKLAEFMENVYLSLKPDSYFLLHYVSRTDIFPNWRKTSRSNACGMANFISEYIFPGGCILHQDWVHQQANLIGFKLIHSETFGFHYMRTLQEWRKNLIKNWSKYNGKHKGNINLYRQYEFYFAFCEAAFRTERINLIQLILYKPKEADNYTPILSYKDKIINPNMRN